MSRHWMQWLCTPMCPMCMLQSTVPCMHACQHLARSGMTYGQAKRMQRMRGLLTRSLCAKAWM